MTSRPSWFLAPRAPLFDCSPDGYLRMGSLISDPRAPDRPIDKQLPSALPEDIAVDGVSKTDWKDVAELHRTKRIGIWARFLSSIRVVDLNAEWNSATRVAYEFKKLEIRHFNPPTRFLKERMANEDVQRFTRAGFIRPRVYMITAVMTVMEPAVSQTKDGSWGMSAKAGATTSASEATAGADFSFSGRSHKQTSAVGSSDFVFAYRLSEVTYERGVAPGQDASLDERPYLHGTTFADGVHKEDDIQLQPADLGSLRLTEVIADNLDLLNPVLPATDILDNGKVYECDCIFL